MASADVTSTCSTMPEGEADISGLNHQQEEREAPDTAVFTPNASAHSDLIVLTFQYSSYKNERKKSCSVVSNSLQPHGLVAYQGPLSMRFSRQEYWSGLPFPSPGDLPNPGIEPRSPALRADALPSEPPGKPYSLYAAAAAAKLLQSCLTLRPHRQQPTRLPCPWDSPGKNTGVGCHFLFQCRKVKSESEVAQSCPTLSPYRFVSNTCQKILF